MWTRTRRSIPSPRRTARLPPSPRQRLMPHPSGGLLGEPGLHKFASRPERRIVQHERGAPQTLWRDGVEIADRRQVERVRRPSVIRSPMLSSGVPGRPSSHSGALPGTAKLSMVRPATVVTRPRDRAHGAGRDPPAAPRRSGCAPKRRARRGRMEGEGVPLAQVEEARDPVDLGTL